MHHSHDIAQRQGFGYGQAEAMVRGCDLLLVLGSSLNVAPASLLPHGTTAPTVIVNRGSVMLPPAVNRHFVDRDLDAYFRDVAALLTLMWEAWNDVFGRTLGRAERSLVQELRDVRNKWAHQDPFSSDDADRALDSMARLLTAVSAPQADDVNKMKLELRRLTFDEQVRSEKRKAGGSLIEAAATGTLKPWREIATPHADVASGR